MQQADRQQAALLRREAKIERLRRDFDLYFRTQVWVRPEIGPIVRPEPRFAQTVIEAVIARQVKEHGWIRLCEFKVRQWGGSTHGVNRGCHRAYLNENISALIVAQDDGTTANLFNMAQLSYEAMDKDIRPVRRYLTKQQIVLENPDPKTRGDFPGLRSRIEVQSAKNVHTAVGTTRNWVHLSEMCRFSRIDDLKGSIIPAIPMMPGTAIIYESAPFGFGEGREEFKQTCEAARSGKSPFAYVAIYWWMVEKYRYPLDKGEKLRHTMSERQIVNLVKRVSKKELGFEVVLTDEQLKFRRLEVQHLGGGDQSIGEALFDQQYPADFENAWNSLDESVFSGYRLEQMNAQHVRPPLRRCEVVGMADNPQSARRQIVDVDQDAPLWIWEDPIPGESYDIGVDPGPGHESGSASAFHVIKRSNNEQVAEYQGQTGAFKLVPVIMAVGWYYNCAHVGVEVENVGSVVDEALKMEGYPNIYIWRYRNHAIPGKLSGYSGWKTQEDSKKVLIEVSKDLLDSGEMIFHSVRLLSEMRNFKHFISDFGNDLYYAANGNDDLVMALMITLTIARDEKLNSLPPESGASDSGRATSVAERERRLLKGIEESAAFMDNPEKAAFLLSEEQVRQYRNGSGGLDMRLERDNDPWSRLANAMKGREQ